MAWVAQGLHVAVMNLSRHALQPTADCAIDFSMDIVRQPDPMGDRVNVVLSGKYLPYKQY